jgi:hypothetical protein
MTHGQWAQAESPPRVKRPKREAVHLPSHGAKVKNGYSYTSTLSYALVE